MPQPQTYKNHTRFHPPFHFILMPLLLIDFAFAITYTIRHRYDHLHLGLWWIVMAIVLVGVAGLSRGYALKAQDRIIRLEERLRFAALLPPADLARASALTEKQLIAIRFASDAELPALVNRALAENLDPKQIKQAITSWRPDYFRV